MKTLAVSAAALSLLLFGAASADALPTPVYTTTYADAVTGDNAFNASDGNRYWTVDPGADSYQIGSYERPTVKNYQIIDGKYATDEYFAYLDIHQAKVGFDDQYLYIAIDLFGLDKSTTDWVGTRVGLVEPEPSTLLLLGFGLAGLGYFRQRRKAA